MRLWAITNGQADLCERTRDVLAAGVFRVVVREVQPPKGLEALIADFPDAVVVHERMQNVEALAGAAGVHFRAGCSIRTGLWGRSCHSVVDVQRAWAQGAAWVFLSPIWAPHSKPNDARATLGPTVLHGLGAVALGGLTPERARIATAAGAAGVATMSGVLDGHLSDWGAELAGVR